MFFGDPEPAAENVALFGVLTGRKDVVHCQCKTWTSGCTRTTAAPWAGASNLSRLLHTADTRRAAASAHLGCPPACPFLVLGQALAVFLCTLRCVCSFGFGLGEFLGDGAQRAFRVAQSPAYPAGYTRACERGGLSVCSTSTWLHPCGDSAMCSGC